MICQEVMELMQRYIDGDLDQQETSLMMDHVGQCPDCAAMLARLQKLSSELELLPRVVPKYSLVDAILPELERLHSVDSAGGAGVSGEDSDTKPATLRSRRPSRHLIGKISGVVAAGVVAGLLLFNDPGQWSLGGSSKNDDAAPMEFSEAPAAENVNPMLEKRAANDSSTLTTKEKGTEFADNSSGTKSISGAENGFEEPTSEDYGITASGSTEQAAVPSMEAPSLVSPDGQVNPLDDIPATLSESPDGKWKAVAVDGEGTYRIYKTADDSEWYTSERKDGKIGLLNWKEDSAVLYFTFTDAEGNQSQWQFDMATSTESKR
ncbi:zf-HC2 domain-containing protein [Cohnella luojiensis]|uniref:Anti-sigma-W factor RsiW n=1 Tax=Cohnella luojiensis TaxID=652876 RepID=A0A4Y8M8G1_9BACL|nr:zf-HC2 domain-containing protein [Cohnella luojiensis]TFE31638.1 hypothetical protein E2980_00735 [Cohnella luojiensis]